jgi:polysaccharide biosynthesis protein PslH
MNVLYVCHRFPFPPKRGGKIRPFNIIKHLSAAHKVTVASLARSDDEAREGTGIAPHCSEWEMGRVRDSVQWLRMVARLPTSVPSSMGYFYSADLASGIRRLLREKSFDLILVHCSSVAQYVEDVRGIPKILDFGDMDSQKWLEYARCKPFPLNVGYWFEGQKVLRAEKILSRKFDLCTATTRAEWETLDRYETGASTDWFPNGVDSQYFAPNQEPYDPYMVSFVGRMDYYPNQQCMRDFCEYVLPLLRKQIPQISLSIVGADPSPGIQRLENLPGVTVTGSVPDVRPYLRRSALMMAPLNIARGTQNKILESMAMGVPVVASRAAAGGVDAVPGHHLLVADSPREYAEVAMRILRDPEERGRLSVAGRQRMLTHHAWSSSMRRLDGIIERCVSSFAASSSMLVSEGTVR